MNFEASMRAARNERRGHNRGDKCSVEQEYGSNCLGIGSPWQSD